MKRHASRLLATILVLAALVLPAPSARGHDLPGHIAVEGFFDHTGAAPELALRIPLILLTNVNLAKRGPGYLDLERIAPDLERAELAVTRAFGIVAGGVRLEPVGMASRISLPSDWTFQSLEAARTAIEGPPLAVTQNVFWNQGYFDVHVAYPPQPLGTRYTLRTDLPAGMADRILVTLWIASPDRVPRILDIEGTTRQIALDPAWYQAGSLFLTKGVEHILIGTDHLLFLLCLILPLLREPRRLIIVVTAFTVGHSVTLIPAALGFAPGHAWFNPLVEVLIAASIVYMAVENVLGGGTRLRWRIAFGFGLIHGFGFASTLTDVMNFAGSHLLTSLVLFNIGIELGQVLVLAVVVPALLLVFRTATIERSGIIVISVLAGHAALHWLTDRAGDIRFEGVGGAEVFPVLTWIAVALVVGFGLWAVGRSLLRPARRRRET